ncbi:MAG: hypothetical protein JWM41_175 [Gemmatimonadetes bacterium]|nr:hypothetical protein [Gemmatimonadota bacterium]
MTEAILGPSWSRWWRALSFALVVAAAAAIVSTARVFSGTVDEPAHIAAGLQWLTTGRYDYDLQHPPLGRVAAAIGPYLRGARSSGAPGVFEEGARVLGSGPRYVDTLASARHGEIVFFLILAAVVWAWARRLTSDAGAAVATLLLVANPTVLAHAGLATTDIACAATTTLALYAAMRWVDEPTGWRSALFGAAAGAALSSRLSAIAFVGAPLAVCYLLRWAVTRSWKLEGFTGAGRTARVIGIATLACFAVIWTAYRFSFGPLHSGGPMVPAPEFVGGVETFFLHGSSGHPTFLLGRPSNRGWWYYFPVALLVKTPLPLILCCIAGGASAVRRIRAARDWRSAVPLVSALTIVALSLQVRVDLGVRLILPVYPLLAIAGAVGVVDLWNRARSRTTQVATALLLACSAIVAVRAYPNNLSYFNPLAGPRPERVLVDSNLDWGQDLYRLRDTIAARGITDTVLVAYFGTADLDAAGLPRARVLGLHERATGWIAASETFLAGEWVGPAYGWLLAYRPVARIGPSMRLWYIPPAPRAVTRDSSPR